jgi:hypothetical protein
LHREYCQLETKSPALNNAGLQNQFEVFRVSLQVSRAV